MPFYEILYETGRMSVAQYADDDEAQSALKNHNDRAVSGEPGGPLGQPAERIRAVYVYANHPDAFNEDQTMTADVFDKEVLALSKGRKDANGVVNVADMGAAVAQLSHPFVTERAPFESSYKMKEDKKLNLAFLEGSAA